VAVAVLIETIDPPGFAVGETHALYLPQGPPELAEVAVEFALVLPPPVELVVVLALPHATITMAKKIPRITQPKRSILLISDTSCGFI
jgi:hypothetical protein